MNQSLDRLDYPQKEPIIAYLQLLFLVPAPAWIIILAGVGYLIFFTIYLLQKANRRHVYRITNLIVRSAVFGAVYALAYHWVIDSLIIACEEARKFVIEAIGCLCVVGFLFLVG